MAANTFGEIFRLTSFGESHGPGIGGIIDGCPAGLAIDLDLINKDLQRRKPGQSSVTTPRKEDDSFEILSGIFDGKTTAGWHSYGKATIGEAWKVADGNLYLDTTKKAGWQTSQGGDILTADEFENFDLKLEWKIAPNGNSGIIFYIHEDTSKYKYVWYTGPEMQVLDNAGHPDSKIFKHRAGDLYDLISSSKETVKPAGEWNHTMIKVFKGHVEHWLNGKKILVAQRDS